MLNQLLDKMFEYFGYDKNYHILRPLWNVIFQNRTENELKDILKNSLNNNESFQRYPINSINYLIGWYPMKVNYQKLLEDIIKSNKYKKVTIHIDLDDYPFDNYMIIRNDSDTMSISFDG